jgi:HPt (histidine-containing phosphotransfer) domain-containing protein
LRKVWPKFADLHVEKPPKKADDATPCVLDPEYLSRLKCNLGDKARELMPVLVERFFAEGPIQIAVARRALTENNMADLGRAARTLKSSALNFGLIALADVSKTLEYHARDNCMECMDVVIDSVETEFDKAKVELRKAETGT